MAEKDIMEKTLESHADVFADIINVLLFQGERIIHEEDLEEKAPRSVYKTDGKIHETERDVVKQWKKDSLFESDFWIVADYFVQMRKNGDYQPTVRQIRHVQETLELLSVLTGDSRFGEAYNEKEGGIHNMCEVLDRIEKKGREEGIEQGILTERERMIRMIYKRGYSVEQISEIVEIPEQAVKLIVGEPVII